MNFPGSPQTTAQKLSMGLQSYLYDRLIGNNRNAAHHTTSSPPQLPRDVLSSVSKLVALIAQTENTKENQNIKAQIREVEGRIMVAQTASFLSPDAANQALAILDQIKDEL